MRTKLKEMMVVIIALIFTGLQLTSPTRTNPPVDESQTIEATMDVPPEVARVFARSCNDCHTNKTGWRWYTHVAPVSWFTVGHVRDGRAELNFSEWGGYGARMKESRLKAICYHVEHHSMPLASYTLMHRDARLSEDEVRAICEWAKTGADPSHAKH